MATESKNPSQEELYHSFKTLKKEAHNLIENGKELEKAFRKQDVSFKKNSKSTLFIFKLSFCYNRHFSHLKEV
jgi:hypothetical protein